MGFGEELMAGGGEVISEVRLARSAAKAALTDQAIALEGGQVRANGVVGQLEQLRQFIDGSLGPAERSEHPARVESKKTIMPFCPLHDLHRIIPPAVII